jgi:hypothetical protein
MSSAATIDNQPTTNRKIPSTKQELIAANIRLLIEQLEAGHSDALTNYLTAMSRFSNYSFGNVLEIARQMPTATRVAGFWTWKNLGRSVNAGPRESASSPRLWAFAARRTRKPRRTSPSRTPVPCSDSAMLTFSTDYLVICGRASARSM